MNERVAPALSTATERKPVTSLRDWLDVLAASGRLAVARPGVDLPRLLPIPVHNELDSGPYITAGLLVSRNPKTGAQNVTIHRLQLSGPKKLGVLLLPRHTLRFFQMAEDAGGDLPVAIVVGVDPLTLLASQAIAP